MKSILIEGRKRDLGGFFVSRSLPSAQRRQVGPFVFLDHMGPLKVSNESKLSVRPHPHIGLSTVTYLFSGQGYHRDSLGSEQGITPGDLNWMTAGRGIVHSERTPPEELQRAGAEIHGIQIWVALPKDKEQCEPEFTHYSKSTLPERTLGSGLKAKVLIGDFAGSESPVKTHSPMFFVDFECVKSSSTPIRVSQPEVGFFLVSGELSINDISLKPDELLIVDQTYEFTVKSSEGSRFVMIGGEPFPEPRHIWWNFVSSDKALIHEAAGRWQRQEMGQVPGETEFIPLPTDPLP